MNINKLGLIKITHALLNIGLDSLAQAFSDYKIFTIDIWQDDTVEGVTVFKCYSENFKEVEVGEKINEYIIEFSYENGKLKTLLKDA